MEDGRLLASLVRASGRKRPQASQQLGSQALWQSQEASQATSQHLRNKRSQEAIAVEVVGVLDRYHMISS